MSTFLRVLIAVAVTSATPGILAAQEPEAGTDPQNLFAEALDVELVNVEVQVHDRHGDPILDLGPGDFHVFEDGRPVEVTHFALVQAEPGGRAQPGARSATQSAPAGMETLRPGATRLAIFIDDVHVGPANRSRVFAQLWETLQSTLRPDDQVMVAAYDSGIRILTPFTSDRDRWLRALDQEGFRGLSARQLQAGFGRERALQTIRDLQRNQTKGATSGFTGSCVDIGWIAQHYAEETHHEVLQTIRALTAFVNSLAGYDGPKALLHVSDGIPLIPGAEVYSYAIELCDGTGAAKGVEFAEDVSILGAAQYHRWDAFSAKTEMLSYDTTEEWQKLASHANAHQVSFYTLQASGLAPFSTRDIGTDVQTSADTARFGVRNLQESLVLLAAESGGQAILNTNDLSRGLEGMVDDVRTHYQIAFEPTPPADGRIHRLRVEVDRPGAHVRHRRSYRSKNLDERVTDGLLSSLLYARTENPLAVQVRAAERKEERKVGDLGKVRVQVRLPISSLTLLPRDQWQQGQFSVFLAARDENGKMTPVRRKPVPVQVPVEGVAEDYVYEVEILMRNGRNEVAVAVRDDLAGTTSFLHRAVLVGGT